MRTIVSLLEDAFRAAIATSYGLDIDPLIGVSQNEKFGDFQANAAMGLAKVLSEKTGQKTNPRAVAEQIVSKLTLGDVAEGVSIAGPGFINVRLSPAWMSRQLREALADERLGMPIPAQRQTVVVDYSGPNIAKELHVGHLRSTIIGDAIARILAFSGQHVVRQNHIGDWGTQFGRVILSIWHISIAEQKRHDYNRLLDMARELLAAVKAKDDASRARIVNELGARHIEEIKADPDGALFAQFLGAYHVDLDKLLPIYQLISLADDTPEAKLIQVPGPTGILPLSEQSKLITSFLQKGSSSRPSNRQEERAWWKVREATLEACQDIYDRLGVLLTEADEYGESRYKPMLPGVVRELRNSGLAVESQGAVAVFIDGEERPPLVIEKAGDLGYLYGTTDLAAIRYRVSAIRANRIVYLVDARQTHHFNQVFAVAKKAGWSEGVSLEHAAFGTMLGEDGRPFKTRSGDTVKLGELLDEAEERGYALALSKAEERAKADERPMDVPEEMLRSIGSAAGIGGVKYSDLSKDRTSDYHFSFEKMLAMDGNTAPYLQYAHARIRSIFRRAGANAATGQIRLESPHELSLARHILRFSEILELVCRELKPHHLCTYLYDLATKFSGFYENCPVLKSDEPTRSSRLALAELTARTLAKGLDLLGIEHPDQM